MGRRFSYVNLASFSRQIPIPAETVARAGASLEWHRKIVDELERRVQNRNFYIWLEAGRRRGKAIDYDVLGREVETWLRGLDPDPHSPQEQGIRPYGPTVDLQIRAIPKTSEARGSPPLVANTFPAVPYWK